MRPTSVGTTRPFCRSHIRTPARRSSSWTLRESAGCVRCSVLSDDGNPDLLWYNETSGRLVTWWYLDDAVVRTSGQFTNPRAASDQNWKVVAAADLSRDRAPGAPPFGVSGRDLA